MPHWHEITVVKAWLNQVCFSIRHLYLPEYCYIINRDLFIVNHLKRSLKAVDVKQLLGTCFRDTSFPWLSGSVYSMRRRGRSPLMTSKEVLRCTSSFFPRPLKGELFSVDCTTDNLAYESLYCTVIPRSICGSKVVLDSVVFGQVLHDIIFEIRSSIHSLKLLSRERVDPFYNRFCFYFSFLLRC